MKRFPGFLRLGRQSRHRNLFRFAFQARGNIFVRIRFDQFLIDGFRRYGVFRNLPHLALQKCETVRFPRLILLRIVRIDLLKILFDVRTGLQKDHRE